MRIIAGSAKGKKLTAPKGLKVRPTADRVKEAIFSMIDDYVSSADVLDIFAGAGQLGLESLSRGADKATFVEKDRRALEALSKNLLTTGFDNKSIVIKKDVFVFLKSAVKDRYSFDLIFADPPYRIDIGLLEFLVSQGLELLKPDGLFVLEHSSKTSISVESNYLLKSKAYGETSVTIFKKKKS